MQTHSSKARSSEQGPTLEAVAPGPGGGGRGVLSLRTVEAVCPGRARGLGCPCPAPRPWPRALTLAWPCSSPHPLSRGPLSSPSSGNGSGGPSLPPLPTELVSGIFPCDSHPGLGPVCLPAKILAQQTLSKYLQGEGHSLEPLSWHH